MISNAFELPIRIKIESTGWVTYWLIFIHTGALVLLLFIEQVLWVKLLLALIALYSFFHYLYHHVWKISPASITEVYLDKNDEWFLSRQDGKIVEASLRPYALVHPNIVILPFRYDLHFPSVVLIPNDRNSDALRRLRVRLRYKRSVNNNW